MRRLRPDVITTLCPVGKERMRRLTDVIGHERADPTLLLTHTCSLKQIDEAHESYGKSARALNEVLVNLESLTKKYGKAYEEGSGFVD